MTVIILCRNEVGFIDRCLASVFAFEPVPGGFEVIVVDGQSDDGTREKLAVWESEKRSLRLLQNPGLVVPVGLNLGIRAARGRLIMGLGAHSEYPTDYLRLAFETIERTAADNVGGALKTMPAGNTLSARLVGYMTTHRFGVGNSRFRVGAAEGPADTVPYGCFRKEVFSQIGWFDERLVRNQDYEFNRRLVESGGTVWCNPSMVVVYYNRSSLRSLLKQAWHTGKWNAWMWYVAPYSFASRHAIPALFVAAELLLSVGAAVMPLARIGLIAVNLCYLAIAGAVGFRHARDEVLWVRALLAVWFLLYHVSYGLGTLVGVGALVTGISPVQRAREPWPGAGRFRAWPTGVRVVFGKRLIDVLISFVGLIVLSPVMGLIAVLIKATSKGPVIYSQARVGRFGRGFRMHKFRSMVQEADSIGSSVTVDRDPRVTRFGRFLRRSKLDELPQLWNVLRGEMSLVGPRPEVPEIVEEYTPAMKRILEVEPGMTSVASLELRAEEELLAGCPEAELAYRLVLVPYKVELGMQHVVRRSARYDLWVLARTVWALTAGRLGVGGHSAVIAEARRRLEAFNRSPPTRIETTGEREGGTAQRLPEWPGAAGGNAPRTKHRDSAS